MAGRKTAKKGEVKSRKSSSKKPSKSKKGGIEMDLLSRKDFLKQAGIAGAALTAMAATGGKAKATGGDYTVTTFLDRDASLVGMGVLTTQTQPNSQVTVNGTTVTLSKIVRMVLRNGQTFSIAGFFNWNNNWHIYYSNDPFENFVWIARLGPDGIVAESYTASEVTRTFDAPQDWTLHGVKTLSNDTTQIIFGPATYQLMFQGLLEAPPRP
ncbi:hypothetical protein KY339_06120 [Candidatus Woesearchaeota archaeon]|nr:hypothetical protein [Candidatus Woesearchaeota archaeon]